MSIMGSKLSTYIGLPGLALLSLTTLASDENVKLTPLGSHDGEYCRFDRALLFEDPDGTRILYDAGRTLAGADDPRLGKMDLVLVSHIHGDHVGDKRIAKPNAGTCDKPDLPVSLLANTNSVEIALANKAIILTGSEMPKFFAGKLKSQGGDPKPFQLVRFGGWKRSVASPSPTD